jgi:spermidine/putrescine transport system ATP-binding protein
VTHDQEEALTMSDKVVVMSDGMIQQIGTPEEIYNEPNTVFVADFIGESNIFNGKMSGKKVVRFCGAEFTCLDDYPVGSDVDVVVRPEDIIMTAPEYGQIKGYVHAVVFKGMHYEITVESGENEIVMRSTKNAVLGDRLGLNIEPDGIHVIPSDTNINIYDGIITALDKVSFADGEFDCDVTQLYPWSRLEQNMLVDKDGTRVNLIGTNVKVKVPVAYVTMSDEIEAGETTGHIISLIYKGDHYHYIVRTKNGTDIHLHDKDLWNEEDYVSITVPKESIQLSLATMEE